MSTIEERTAYLKNPFLTKAIYGDFSPFYITIGICTVIGISIFVLNIVLGCCSKHREYWQDRHTGNRWLVSIWTATPHKQPPLDLTELEDVRIHETLSSVEYAVDSERTKFHHTPLQPQFSRPPRASPQHHHRQEEFLELHPKRESDI